MGEAPRPGTSHRHTRETGASAVSLSSLRRSSFSLYARAAYLTESGSYRICGTGESQSRSSVRDRPPSPFVNGMPINQAKAYPDQDAKKNHFYYCILAAFMIAELSPNE